MTEDFLFGDIDESLTVDIYNSLNFVDAIALDFEKIVREVFNPEFEVGSVSTAQMIEDDWLIVIYEESSTRVLAEIGINNNGFRVSHRSISTPKIIELADPKLYEKCLGETILMIERAIEFMNNVQFYKRAMNPLSKTWRERSKEILARTS